MNYVIFESQGEPTNPKQTTTRWDNSVIVEIPLSGMIDGTFYNLMKMKGSISDWLAENEGKVRKVTKAEINELGRQIVPEGTTVTYRDVMTGEEKTSIAGVFDIDSPQNLWTDI